MAALTKNAILAMSASLAIHAAVIATVNFTPEHNGSARPGPKSGRISATIAATSPDLLFKPKTTSEPNRAKAAPDNKTDKKPQTAKQEPSTRSKNNGNPTASDNHEPFVSNERTDAPPPTPEFSPKARLGEAGVATVPAEGRISMDARQTAILENGETGGFMDMGTELSSALAGIAVDAPVRLRLFLVFDQNGAHASTYSVNDGPSSDFLDGTHQISSVFNSLAFRISSNGRAVMIVDVSMERGFPETGSPKVFVSMHKNKTAGDAMAVPPPASMRP